MNKERCDQRWEVTEKGIKDKGLMAGARDSCGECRGLKESCMEAAGQESAGAESHSVCLFLGNIALSYELDSLCGV